MRKNILITIAFAALLAAGGLVLSAVATGEAAAKTPIRNIYLSAVEWKGSANISKEPFPTQTLPSGGGYEIFEPGHPEVANEPGKWAVETYRFDSALVAACKGDKVVLNIFGVNSPQHQIAIPDFNRNVLVKRGYLAKTSFVVKRTGLFPILCITHKPSHQADLLVVNC